MFNIELLLHSKTPPHDQDRPDFAFQTLSIGNLADWAEFRSNYHRCLAPAPKRVKSEHYSSTAAGVIARIRPSAWIQALG